MRALHVAAAMLGICLSMAAGCTDGRRDDGTNIDTGTSSETLLPGTCEEGPTGCDANAECITVGTEHRCECGPGFRGDGLSCVTAPAPDCSVHHGDCSFDADCTDTPQGPLCVCRTYFTGDGKRCTWVDPCSKWDACPASARCESSTNSGPNCHCDLPTRMAADGSCVFCLETCDASKDRYCLNEYLSPAPSSHTDIFECHCRLGWVMSGDGCEPICDTTNACRWDGHSTTCTRLDNGKDVSCAVPCDSNSDCPQLEQCIGDVWGQRYCG